jgi:hypothetical protein
MHYRLKLSAAFEARASFVQRWRKGALMPATHFTDLSEAIPSDLRARVADEIGAVLRTSAVRRDLAIAQTGYTPRRYRIATRTAIAASCPLTAELYRARELLALISQIAGERLVPVPYEPEEFVATRLERAGDTHGWHWDDYAYALVWVLEAPGPDCGGELELVPDAAWCKDDPRVGEILATQSVERKHLPAGSVYLLRSDTTMHRVAPLRCDTSRSVLCFSYATSLDLKRRVSHETVDAIYAAGTAS